MFRIAGFMALVMVLALALSGQGRRQDAGRDACIERCVTQPQDEEVQRQEIVSLEKEAARAIQLNSGTFFYRIYSDDFAGTLSHGQQINKLRWIAAVESPLVKRDAFNVPDIRVRIFRDTAFATCLWSTRFTVNGLRLCSRLPP